MIFDKSYSLHTEIWEDELHIVFTSDIKAALAKRYTKYKIKDAPPDTDYAGALFLPVRDIITQPFSGWLMFDMKHINDGIILHECFHATSNVLKHRGFILHDESEEAFTYTHQYLFNKVVSLYRQVAPKYKTYARKKRK